MRTSPSGSSATIPSREEDRQLLARAVGEETRDYLRDRAAYCSRTVVGGRGEVTGADKVDMLFLANVISRYRGHPELQALKTQRHSTEEAGTLLRFPQGLATKTADFLAGKEPFAVRELAFAFVARVDLCLHSANLRCIGAAVTDCPGLSACAHDSRIAMDVVRESDAVWYLLEGRAIGASELKDIEDAHKAAAGKMLVTVNLKSDVNPTRRHIESAMVPHLASQLRAVGVDVELRPYHALLAYLAMVGPDLLAGRSDRSTRAVLTTKASEAGFTPATPDEAWSLLAEEMVWRLKVPESGPFTALHTKLCDEGIALVRRASELDTTIARIMGYVVEQRAAAVLDSGGARRALQALSAIDKCLGARESEAESTVAETERKFAAMEARLAAFQQDSGVILKNLESTDPDRALAADFIDEVVLPSLPKAAEIATPWVIQSTGYLDALWTLVRRGLLRGRDRSSLEADIEEILRSSIKEASDPACEAWLTRVRTGSNVHFRKFLELVGQCQEKLRQDWEQALNSMPDLTSIPEPVLTASRGCDHLVPATLRAELSEVRGEILWSDAMRGMVGGLTGWAIFGTIAFFTPGIGAVFTAICVAVCAVFWVLYKDREEFKVRLRESIENGLTKGITDRRDELVRVLAEEQMLRFRGAYRGLFRAGLKGQRDSLDQQRRRARADMEASQEDRQRIAEECRATREQDLAPLISALDAFCEEVQQHQVPRTEAADAESKRVVR